MDVKTIRWELGGHLLTELRGKINLRTGPSERRASPKSLRPGCGCGLGRSWAQHHYRHHHGVSVSYQDMRSALLFLTLGWAAVERAICEIYMRSTTAPAGPAAAGRRGRELLRDALARTSNSPLRSCCGLQCYGRSRSCASRRSRCLALPRVSGGLGSSFPPSKPFKSKVSIAVRQPRPPASPGSPNVRWLESMTRAFWFDGMEYHQSLNWPGNTCSRVARMVVS
ncbi:hypothetical protein F5148DRAFT_1169487 [Russula earlei]|uniref:Uncharacterized protein n=1 Tax=Russula earlei TaxID=71964 RepID=A0ACC0UJC6_9AGAM|nr:hypothetical protein F5148DRAFT_1169487 [Russula earlei]